MFIVHIDHQVRDFDEWKQLFDSDPLDREGSGVRTYRVQRDIADPNHAFVDLEFGSRDEADEMLIRLRAMWERVDVFTEASGTVFEVVEVGHPSHAGV